MLAVLAGAPHKSLADVLKFSKANPDKMTFAFARWKKVIEVGRITAD